MNLSPDRIKEVLFSAYNHPKLNSSKTEIISACPYCNKEKHFYVNINTGLYHCHKCDADGNLYTLLKKIGKSHLIEFQVTSIGSIQNKLSLAPIEEEEEEIPLVKWPLGFQRIYSDQYLEERGLRSTDFQKYHIGETKLLSNYRDAVIFLINPIEKKCTGWIARFRNPKEYRYLNSGGSFFSKQLFGSDEFTEETDTVILVEGIFDKMAVDRALDLDSQERVKSCATFGKKVAVDQIKLLKKNKIKKIFLIYDSDAIEQSKVYAFKLNDFFEIFVNNTENRDLDEIEGTEIKRFLEESKTPFEYYLDRIQKRKFS